jgi:8-oxo-dGTP pyrophosphatase MutT (NUDIX family)
MTSVLATGPRLEVVGVDALGTEVARLVLRHGEDPGIRLAGLGWEVRRARDVSSEATATQVLTMTFVVEAAVARAPHAVDPLEPAGELRQDDDLVLGEGEVAQRYQRVSAHAFVTSSRGVLMTQFSDRTNAPGKWGLPGGGLEPHEEPDRAVLREVWEESGQVIEVSELALVQSRHWIGRAPGGRLEDFHAVRLVYRAACPEPTEPVVHDVGGTTASAAWMPAGDLELLEVTPGWRSVLRDVSNLDGRGA